MINATIQRALRDAVRVVVSTMLAEGRRFDSEFERDEAIAEEATDLFESRNPALAGTCERWRLRRLALIANAEREN